MADAEELREQLRTLATAHLLEAAPNQTWMVSGWRIGVAPHEGEPRLIGFKDGYKTVFATIDEVADFVQAGPAPDVALPPPPPAARAAGGSRLMLIVLGTVALVAALAIAIPTLLSGDDPLPTPTPLGAGVASIDPLTSQKRAQDREAQAALRNTITAARTVFTDNENYGEATPAKLQTIEPSLIFVESDVPSDGPTTVSVASPAPDRFVASSLSATGTCWYVRDGVGPGGAGIEWAVSTQGTCAALAAPDAGWVREPPEPVY